MNLQNFLVIVNLFLIEALLSVDNAAVLATFVKNLPVEMQKKAMTYGIWGAYVFRGASLFLVSFLMKVLFLKFLGGAYLLYIAYGHFFSSENVETAEPKTWIGKGIQSIRSFVSMKFEKFHAWTMATFGVFWSTVAAVEFLDLCFSIDNVFAAVALSKNIWVIMAGVFIGILAMRFVAVKFVGLMNRHPQLETSAFVVIALLGFKLVASYLVEFAGHGSFAYEVVNGHYTDAVFSAVTIIIFAIPLLFKGKKEDVAHNMVESA